MREKPKIKILIIGKNSNLSKHFQNKFKSNKYLELIIVGRNQGYDHKNGGKKILFPSKFTKGKKSMKINVLVWMGNEKFMQIKLKKK